MMEQNLKLWPDKSLISVGKLVLIEPIRPQSGWLTEYIEQFDFDNENHIPYIRQKFKLETRIGMIVSHKFTEHDYFDNGLIKMVLYEILINDSKHIISIEDARIIVI